MGCCLICVDMSMCDTKEVTGTDETVTVTFDRVSNITHDKEERTEETKCPCQEKK